jgi:Transposase
MGVAVGIDVAKEFHWVRAISSERSELPIDRRVAHHPAALAALVEELEALRTGHGDLRVGIDVVGGIAGLLAALLLEASIEVVHVSGLAVNRARQGTTGGEHKSDPRDAAVITDQVLRRRDLRALAATSELDAEIRLLVGRRRELVVDQTRRVSRLHDLLASVHPGLERVVEPTRKGSQRLLARYVTPTEIRRAGRRRLVDHISRAGRLPARQVEELADAALAASRAQTIAVPGERVAAALVRELAGEAERARERLAALDRQIEAALERHPDAALIRKVASAAEDRDLVDRLRAAREQVALLEGLPRGGGRQGPQAGRQCPAEEQARPGHTRPRPAGEEARHGGRSARGARAGRERCRGRADRAGGRAAGGLASRGRAGRAAGAGGHAAGRRHHGCRARPLVRDGGPGRVAGGLPLTAGVPAAEPAPGRPDAPLRRAPPGRGRPGRAADAGRPARAPAGGSPAPAGRPAGEGGGGILSDDFGTIFNAAIHRRHPPEPEPPEPEPARPGPADAGAGVGSPGPQPSFGAALNAALREPRQRRSRLEVW